MRKYPKLSAAVVWILATAVSFVAMIAIVGLVGELTNSVALGPCGPAGPMGGAMILMGLCALPASVIGGYFAAPVAYRRLRREKQKPSLSGWGRTLPLLIPF